MTLGQRIGQYRKTLGLSQEALGERLGVSRQAVSKWETDSATPDMENLLALAREFGIPMAELTDTPSTAVKTPRWWRIWWPLASLGLVLFLAILFIATSRRPLPADPPTTPPVAAPDTEFALLWDGPGEKDWLALGIQEDFFPFGTGLALTAPEEIFDTDFAIMKAHRADCGPISIAYNHIAEDLEMDPTPEREVITSLSSMVPGYTTPCGIGPGSPKADVLVAYGDALVYCLKEEGSYSLLPHEYYYAYAPAGEGAAILFYMADGLVAGITLESLGEMPEAYVPNHLYRFPLVNGEPDFSLREEPEQEVLSDTRKVYIAFNQLITNKTLTAEEVYAYRRDVFGLLPSMDWSEYRLMGTAEDGDDTLFALMQWLANQDTYSPSEILWIQLGCTATGLDGAYTDSYCHVLAQALFYAPVTFAKQLATDGAPEETMSHAVGFTRYDAVWFPQYLSAAVETLETALSDGTFTDEESGWAKLLLYYFATETADGSIGDFPKTPAELP